MCDRVRRDGLPRGLERESCNRRPRDGKSAPSPASRAPTSQRSAATEPLDQTWNPSTDGIVYALRTFAEGEGLNFPLLSDWWPHGAVSRDYEVFDEAKGAPSRSSYVVDREGRLRWSVHNANPDGRDLDEHLRQLADAV